MANELQLSAGLKLTNPNPVDAYFMLPAPAGGRAQPYTSIAQACQYVPQAVRYDGQTVNINGQLYAWYNADLSNAGLVPKLGAGTYTDEQAQDAVAQLLEDSPTIAGRYDDAGNVLTFEVRTDSVGKELLSPQVRALLEAQPDPLTASLNLVGSTLRLTLNGVVYNADLSSLSTSTDTPPTAGDTTTGAALSSGDVFRITTDRGTFDVPLSTFRDITKTTGSLPQSRITGLVDALAGKASSGHTHALGTTTTPGFSSNSYNDLTQKPVIPAAYNDSELRQLIGQKEPALPAGAATQYIGGDKQLHDLPASTGSGSANYYDGPGQNTNGALTQLASTELAARTAALIPAPLYVASMGVASGQYRTFAGNRYRYTADSDSATTPDKDSKAVLDNPSGTTYDDQPVKTRLQALEAIPPGSRLLTLPTPDGSSIAVRAGLDFAFVGPRLWVATQSFNASAAPSGGNWKIYWDTTPAAGSVAREQLTTELQATLINVTAVDPAAPISMLAGLAPPLSGTKSASLVAVPPSGSTAQPIEKLAAADVGKTISYSLYGNTPGAKALALPLLAGTKNVIVKLEYSNSSTGDYTPIWVLLSDPDKGRTTDNTNPYDGYFNGFTLFQGDTITLIGAYVPEDDFTYAYTRWSLYTESRVQANVPNAKKQQVIAQFADATSTYVVNASLGSTRADYLGKKFVDFATGLVYECVLKDPFVNGERRWVRYNYSTGTSSSDGGTGTTTTTAPARSLEFNFPSGAQNTAQVLLKTADVGSFSQVSDSFNVASYVLSPGLPFTAGKGGTITATITRQDPSLGAYLIVSP